MDCVSVWQTTYENFVFSGLGLQGAIVGGEQLSPTTPCATHWMHVLRAGLKVLVVSPFASTIEAQVPKLDRVWRDRYRLEASFTCVRFPYLTEYSCPETWWDVYARVGELLKTADYHVALFGCGGLGLPLAAVAKAAGKVGLHLGGHCQLVFGIYGRRHLEQEWHRNWINEAWTRPLPDEVPPSAMKVEGGCYW